MHMNSVLRSAAGWRRPLGLVASITLAWSLALAATAAEVKVFADTAFKPVIVAMTPIFEKRTGHKLVVISDSAERVAERIRAGEAFDLAVLPPALLEALGRDGSVSDGSIIALARDRAGAQNAAVYAGAVSTMASNSPPALSLLILLASEETQAVLKGNGLAAP